MSYSNGRFLFLATLTGLLLLLSPFPAVSGTPATLQGEVVGISDGDTLTLLVERQTHKIRLAEIDCPEAGQDWGSRARQALASKVFRREVTVHVVDTDRYGRLVGRVWLGERDINRELVREGHAWVYRRYLTDDSLLAEEASAKAAGIGLWSLDDPVAPWEWRRQGSGGSDSQRAPSQSAAGGCTIKGNISASGGRIYHLPGQRYYERTRIDAGKGERWFCTEREAQAAGWRKSKV